MGARHARETSDFRRELLVFPLECFHVNAHRCAHDSLHVVDSITGALGFFIEPNQNCRGE